MIHFTKAKKQVVSSSRVQRFSKSTPESNSLMLLRLRSFLDEEESKAARFLHRIWVKQQSEVTYKELREAILTGALPIALLESWRLDYVDFVNNILAPNWENSIAVATEVYRKQFPYIYQPSIDEMQKYIKKHSAELVTNVINSQKQAIQSMVFYGTGIGMTPESLSRIIRPTVGLTRPQTTANLNYYNNFLNTLKENHPKMTQASAEKKALEAAIKYAGKQHRFRAMNIARTELAFAYNNAHLMATEDAYKQGLIGEYKKVWLTADDERTCPICGSLDGESVFQSNKFSDGHFCPPSHPSCRCSLIFEETYPGELLPKKIDTGAFEWVSDLPLEDKIKFLGGEVKAALFDAGLLSKNNYFTPLTNMNLSGIIIPDRKTLRHAMVGDFKIPSSDSTEPRLKGGGHTVISMGEMRKRGITFNVVRTASNGVMFGNVPRHKKAEKQTGEGQIWFPRDWRKHDVRVAGLIAANRGSAAPGYTRAFVGEYKGVKTIVFIDHNNKIGTIAPYKYQ